MNKLLTLTNMELKRNSKFYAIYLGIVSSLILGINIIQIDRFSKRYEMIDKMKDNFDGVFYGVSILFNNNILANIITFSISGIIIYSVYTWIREYTQKSIYTMKMLPYDKFNIYLSKMISTITMIYGVLISQIIVLFISKQIFNMILNKEGVINTSLFNDLTFLQSYHQIIPTTFITFFMVYVIGMICKLSIVFTLVVITISFKNNMVNFIAVIIGTIVIFLRTLMKIAVLINYTGIFYISGYTSNIAAKYIGNLGVDIVGNVLVIAILSYISYKLINKKLYI